MDGEEATDAGRSRTKALRPFAVRRRELGISQREAAHQLRISASYLSRLENGHAPLTLTLARRMSRIYATSTRSLIQRGG